MSNHDKKVRTGLQKTYVSFQAWARENNIYHSFVALNEGIYGFVYKSRFNNYFIIIDKNLSKEMQKEVFIHEVDHIMYDFPESGYVIGIDMKHSPLEEQKLESMDEVINFDVG